MEDRMKKLDWSKLLGFDQLVSDRDRASVRNSRLTGKIGAKAW
jgi:hypothetical protein